MDIYICEDYSKIEIFVVYVKTKWNFNQSK